jgi:C4-dicarboxylate-specific signal transduction histidine kinase
MKRGPLLVDSLRWFIELRWLAGAAVVVAGLLNWLWLRWYGQGGGTVAVGVGILAYNAALLVVLRRITARERAKGSGRATLLGLAWIQIALDVSALSLLAVWTGGAHSPLLGMFVLHMVFASLLLPRMSAYAGAAGTIASLLGALLLVHQRVATREEGLLLLGWAAALLCTVFVGSQIARSLRRQRGRLVRQTRKLLAMQAALRRQQRAMAQHEKMVALGQMAAGVAHEIANPLASIDSLLQLMRRKPEKLKSQSVETLRLQADRIARIVRELTTFSRPAEQERQTLAVNDVVREGVQMVSFDPRMKRVRLEESFADDAGYAPLEPQAIQQVLVNLLRNALDAIEDCAEPALMVRTARVEDCWVLIEVVDNGPGIAQKHLKRLFEPFFTTKPVGKGTGLGLSISYSLVARHGGSISVASKPGEGAAFRVKLPAEARERTVIGARR